MVIIFVIMSDKSKKESTGSNIVKEPMAVYVTPGMGNPFYNLLGASGSLKFSNEFDVINLARKGFSKSALLALGKKISLTLQELANILHISERTLQRYDDNEIIKTEYAEKAV